MTMTMSEYECDAEYLNDSCECSEDKDMTRYYRDEFKRSNLFGPSCVPRYRMLYLFYGYHYRRRPICYSTWVYPAYLTLTLLGSSIFNGF